MTTGVARLAGVEHGALDEALRVAAERVGRLSDEQVRAMRRQRRAAAAVPAMLALGTLAVFGVGRLDPPRQAAPVHESVFATLPGQLGTARLADGSSVRLNGATRLRVRFSQGARSVELLAGQAFFDVRHDAARPFVVRAGAGEARVLGTAFDLERTERQVSLAVYRGAVGFDGAGKHGGLVVRAGYRSRLRDGRIEAPTGFDPALPDWRQGWIDTQGMRLDDLVDVLRRQGAAVAPPTGKLAGVTVAGRFRTDRPGELLRAIGDGLGFTVTERDGAIVLLPAR